jgi:DNA polymerase-4
VGRVTEQVLLREGVRTVGELQDYRGDRRTLAGSFGLKLKQFAVGEDDRPLDLGDEVKSTNGKETFPHDTEGDLLRVCPREQAAEIAVKLKRRHLAARTIQAKLRYGDFTTLTRQVSVEGPITDAMDT